MSRKYTSYLPGGKDTPNILSFVGLVGHLASTSEILFVTDPLLITISLAVFAPLVLNTMVRRQTSSQEDMQDEGPSDVHVAAVKLFKISSVDVPTRNPGLPSDPSLSSIAISSRPDASSQSHALIDVLASNVTLLKEDGRSYDLEYICSSSTWIATVLVLSPQEESPLRKWLKSTFSRVMPLDKPSTRIVLVLTGWNDKPIKSPQSSSRCGDVPMNRVPSKTKSSARLMRTP
mmetsp:Transcript_24685/g.36827  ORF Transcript_24685/g.36827 Transcript_24685/m.36827 type:complete len:232 (+) Transcript_24685:1503-2198(+)